MKPTFVAILLFAISFQPIRAQEIPEFLIPVDGSEEASVRATNDYFLQRHLYFAKRHRIVKVDTRLLEKAERFRISLFENESAVVEVVRRDIRKDRLTMIWNGQFVDPTVTLEELVKEGVPLADAKLVHPELVGLDIAAAAVSYDKSTNTKFAYFYPRFEQFRSANSKSSVSANAELWEVGFTIAGGVLDGHYELRPLEILELGTQHHVLVEFDPGKQFSKGPTNDPENPVEGAKRQAYYEFLNSLGPDPRSPDRYKE